MIAKRQKKDGRWEFDPYRS